MSQQSNTFPMFFTLEHVKNGFILTAKEETDSLTQEPQFKKEVVTSEKINERIGNLLCLDTLKMEHPAVFHVEVVGEKTYKIEELPDRDNLTVAKLSFSHFNSRKYPENRVIVLQILDTGMVEIYGRDAERISDANDIALNRSDGIPFIRFSGTKDGMKTLASYVRNPTVIRVSESQIMEWYNGHMVQQDLHVAPAPPNNKKK